MIDQCKKKYYRYRFIASLMLFITFFSESYAFYLDDSCFGWGPLKECHWRAGLRGALGSICYTDRTKNLLIGQSGTNGIVGTTPVPCYPNQFRQPWSLGVFIGYDYNDKIELFLDGEYTNATGKTYSYVVGPYAISDEFKPYLEWSIYLGQRYYFPLKYYCGFGISPFIGAKLGVTNYHRVRFFEDYTAPESLSFPVRYYFVDHTVPSIGAQIGLEYFINRSFSLNLMAEFIYSGQMKGSRRVVNGGDGVQTLSVGDTGPLFSVPISIGLNYAL